MKKILISGNSNKAVNEIKERISQVSDLKYVAVFFENANFLVTKYRPLSNGVCMILELEDQTELHIEGANCGYGGGGPHATLKILRMFGLEENYLERLVFENDAVQFCVNDKKIVTRSINTTYLFYPKIRETSADKSMRNKIRIDRNVDVDLRNAKVMIYNPHRSCFKGMLNLLGYMDDIEFEYYLGSNSSLEGGLHLEKKFNSALYNGIDKPDLKGIEHVNLVLKGENLKVICWIDRADEKAVIESIYLSLTGERLFENRDDWKKDISVWDMCKRIIKSFKKRPQEIYGKKEIISKQLGNGLR